MAAVRVAQGQQLGQEQARARALAPAAHRPGSRASRGPARLRIAVLDQRTEPPRLCANVALVDVAGKLIVISSSSFSLKAPLQSADASGSIRRPTKQMPVALPQRATLAMCRATGGHPARPLPRASPTPIAECSWPGHPRQTAPVASRSLGQSWDPARTRPRLFPPG